MLPSPPKWLKEPQESHGAPCGHRLTKAESRASSLDPLNECLVMEKTSGKLVEKVFSRWWFQIFFILTPIWGRFPF